MLGHVDWKHEQQQARGQTRTVPCCTAHALFAKHGISAITFLQIDTEGNDARIINSIDLDQHPIDVIMWEHWGFGPECFCEYNPLNGIEGMRLIQAKLRQHGYRLGRYGRRSAASAAAPDHVAVRSQHWPPN